MKRSICFIALCACAALTSSITSAAPDDKAGEHSVQAVPQVAPAGAQQRPAVPQVAPAGAQGRPAVHPIAPAGVKARVAGSVFRSLSKAFVAASDIEPMKKGAMRKMSALGPGEFKAYYNDFYEHVAGWQYIEKTYSVRKDMPKEEALNAISSLDKTRLYSLIDSLPDEVIAREYRRYAAKYVPEESDPTNMTTMIKVVNRLIAGVKRKYTGS